MKNLVEDYSPEEFRQMHGGEEAQQRTSVQIVTASALLAAEFQEPKFAVPGILSEGATLLAGRPKLGKSWLALAIAVAIAFGGRVLGKIAVERGDVLYLALEDGARRLQSRLQKLLADVEVPERLFLSTDWQRLDEGGLIEIENWLRSHPNARLVVIDTFKRVRPQEKRSGRLYDGDYDAIAPLSALGLKYGVSILIVHHTRKQPSEDAFDTISGSTGLSGAVDGLMVLQRAKGGEAGAELHITGRDFEEQSLALKWDAPSCGWILLGDAAEFTISKERREILDLLKIHGSLKPGQISEKLGRSPGADRRLLPKMVEDGLLSNDGNGNYSVSAGNSSNRVTYGSSEIESSILDTIENTFEF